MVFGFLWFAVHSSAPSNSMYLVTVTPLIHFGWSFWNKRKGKAKKASFEQIDLSLYTAQANNGSISHKSINWEATPISNCQPVRLLNPDCCYKYKYWITNCRSRSEANWSGSTRFAKTIIIWQIIRLRIQSQCLYQNYISNILED